MAEHTRPTERDLSYYDDRAHGLLAVLADGAPATLAQVRVWHPAFTHASDDALRSAPVNGSFTLDDARLVYAREHGHPSWDAFAAHLRRLAAGEVREPFLDVIEAGKQGDWTRLGAILEGNPSLVHARGTNGNTLLNIAGSLVASPANDLADAATLARAGADRLAPLTLLLDMGADANAANDRGWTPGHQAAYRDDAAMIELLLARGARVDLEAHGSGGTPLAVACFWGHRDAADRLAREGVVPANLRIAAATGREDLVEACFDASGALTVDARASRGFYRPHSGFPTWHPSDDAQEVLDEALVWAAKSGRVNVMPALVARGANVAADPYRGTALAWAAWTGRDDAVAWLLDHGADVNQRGTFGGEEHGRGISALHLAAQRGRRSTSELLVARGADLTIADANYEATAEDWARHEGHGEIAAFLARA